MGLNKIKEIVMTPALPKKKDSSYGGIYRTIESYGEKREIPVDFLVHQSGGTPEKIEQKLKNLQGAGLITIYNHEGKDVVKLKNERKDITGQKPQIDP